MTWCVIDTRCRPPFAAASPSLHAGYLFDPQPFQLLRSLVSSALACRWSSDCWWWVVRRRGEPRGESQYCFSGSHPSAAESHRFQAGDLPIGRAKTFGDPPPNGGEVKFLAGAASRVEGRSFMNRHDGFVQDRGHRNLTSVYALLTNMGHADARTVQFAVLGVLQSACITQDKKKKRGPPRPPCEGWKGRPPLC